MPQVSIIIPVYNNSLEDMQVCFDSIRNQTYQDYEVIIVDDGSCQECADNLDKLALLFRQARVLHQENQGVSAARNAGTQAAAGQYITYIDADDVVAPYMLSHAMEVLAGHEELDVVYGYTKKFSETDKEYGFREERHELWVLSPSEKHALQCHMVDELHKQFIKKDGGYIFRGPFAHFIRRSLALAVPFPLGVAFGEDGIRAIELVGRSHKIAIVNELWYAYIQRQGSAVHRFRPDAVMDVSRHIEGMYKLAPQGDKEYMYSLQKKTTSGLGALVNSYYYGHPEYPHSIFHAIVEFNSLLGRQPFCSILQWRYMRPYDIKSSIRLLAIKIGLGVPGFLLNRLLGRLLRSRK